jgi:hypothetical protein
MRSIIISAVSLGICLSSPVFANDSVFCPGNNGYINTGMTMSQVVSACGQPSSIEQAKQAAVKRVPVTQLIYTNVQRGAVYSGYDITYQMWSLPSGSTQLSFEVDVIDNKVSAIKMNGSSSNATNICGDSDTAIQIGASADDVYSACGAPSAVNQTYINQPIPSNTKPIVWNYNFGQYQPSLHLTFLDGILQSIN